MKTPQTNTAKFTFQDACLEGFRAERYLVDAFLSQTLEEERNEARKLAEELRELVDWNESDSWKFPWED